MQVKTVDELPKYKDYIESQKWVFTQMESEHLFTKELQEFLGNAYYLELLRIATDGHVIPKRVINSLPKRKREYMKENFK